MIDRKRILFIGIGFYDYDKAIINQLEKLNYQVDYFCEVPSSFKYRYDIRKGNKLKIQKTLNELSLSIAHAARSDYHNVFIIKGENLTNEAIDIIKKKNPNAKWVLYLWDSVSRVPGSKKIFHQFHEIYSFDRMDCISNSDLKFNPLFYREEYARHSQGSMALTDLYFLGWYHSDRLKLIEKVIVFCRENNLKHNIKLYVGFFSYLTHFITGNELKHFKKYLIHKPISATENVNSILNSNCTLDIAHPLQNGLTMRTIELVGAQRKIITTNADIVNYDFYNEDNVLILDRSNPVLNIDFFRQPYKELDKGIVQQYALSNWLSKMI
jgi:hypothetical protein